MLLYQPRWQDANTRTEPAKTATHTLAGEALLPLCRGKQKGHTVEGGILCIELARQL